MTVEKTSCHVSVNFLTDWNSVLLVWTLIVSTRLGIAIILFSIKVLVFSKAVDLLLENCVTMIHRNYQSPIGSSVIYNALIDTNSNRHTNGTCSLSVTLRQSQRLTENWIGCFALELDRRVDYISTSNRCMITIAYIIII